MKIKIRILKAAAVLASAFLLIMNVGASSFKTSSGIDDHGDFTIAVVPDMQVLSKDHPESLSVLTGWIADNVEKENIRFVTFLGDMTDDNKKGEWADVKAATDLLKGKVSFSVINGNRDMNDKSQKRDLERFTSAYPLSDFESYPEYGGAYSDDCLNTFYTFEQGGLKYMILCLEFAPRDGVIDWAKSVIEAHPGHNVIITTHGFLDDDGNVIEKTSADSFFNYSYIGGEGNCGDKIRDELLLKYNNIVLLLCGHRGDGDLVSYTSTTSDGTKTVALMANGTDIDKICENGAGMVLLLHFKNGSGEVSCEYYSTVLDKYYGNRNQISLKLDTVMPDNASCIVKGQNNQTSQTDNTNKTGPNETHLEAVIYIALAAAALAFGVAFVILKRKKKR